MKSKLYEEPFMDYTVDLSITVYRYNGMGLQRCWKSE